MKKKYRILITAHVNEDCIDILHEVVSFNIMTKDEAFLDILKEVTPTIDWAFDDGDIYKGSTYCQYACYVEGCDKYFLASFEMIYK